MKLACVRSASFPPIQPLSPPQALKQPNRNHRRRRADDLSLLIWSLACVALGFGLGSMAAYPLHPRLPASNFCGGVSPSHLIAVATSLRARDLLRERYASHLHLLLCSYSSSMEDAYHLVQKKGFWCPRSYSLKSSSLLQKLSESFTASCASCFSFFSGKDFGGGYENEGKMQMKNTEGRPVDGRIWTNVLLAINVLVYAAQIATQGKLLLWGAKVNSLINKGEVWRLATSSLLHANIGHLMVNCYSFNSIGPIVEQLSGSRRFLAVYFASAICRN